MAGRSRPPTARDVFAAARDVRLPPAAAPDPARSRQHRKARPYGRGTWLGTNRPWDARTAAPTLSPSTDPWAEVRAESCAWSNHTPDGEGPAVQSVSEVRASSSSA